MFQAQLNLLDVRDNDSSLDHTSAKIKAYITQIFKFKNYLWAMTKFFHKLKKTHERTSIMLSLMLGQ